jgi:hypothetical protein
MSDFRSDPNFPRYEMNDSDVRVQWAAVAVILLLVAGLIAAAAWTGAEPQTANGPAIETTGSGASLGSTATMPPAQRPPRH